MRRFILLILALVLAASQLLAQRQLPPSFRPYTENWSFTTKKMLNATGYDFPVERAAVPAGWHLETRAAELRLDSTVTFQGYNSMPVDTFPVYRTLYKYPSDDVEVQEEYFYDNGAWVAEYRTTLFTDELGRLVSIQADTYDPEAQDWAADGLVDIFPRGNSPDQVDSLLAYAWSTAINDWELLAGIWNSFDEEGRLVESLSVIDLFGETFNLRDVYSYDTNGDNTLVESFLIFDGSQFPFVKQEKVYANHLLISETELMADVLGGFTPETRTTYTYTDFDEEETIESYQWDADNNNWVLTAADNYDYDAQQRVIAIETVYYADNVIQNRERLTYTYDDNDNLALETFFYFDFGQNIFVITDRTYYFYSTGTTSISRAPEAIRLVISPNPTYGPAQLSLESDSWVRLFDQSGRFVKVCRTVAGDSRLDLSGLAAGSYTVIVQSAGKYYSGKVIKY